MRKAAFIVLTLYLLAIGFAVSKADAAGITRHDRQVITFFQHHPKLAATPAGGRVLAKILPHVARALQAADARASPSWPAHHQLWLCIHNHEAGSWYDHDSGGNGHYGGLQMSWGWLGYVHGDAGYLSQLQQEQVAEKAYAASGYSQSFLWGQWFDYEDGGSACLTYA